jgi:hypothetical protein
MFMNDDMMSYDIVAMLRERAGCWGEIGLLGAADEIERLRNRLEKFERAAWELSMYGVFTDTASGRKALDTYSKAVRGE